MSNSVSIISAADSVASKTTDTSGDVVKSKTPSQLISGENDVIHNEAIQYVLVCVVVSDAQAEIRGFRRRFNSINLK